jgi:primosomal protein N' (replication factor Y) (superfamily II helicase)
MTTNHCCTMYYSVALLSPPYSTLTYADNGLFPAAFWRAGLRVAVPLGTGAWRVGVLLGSSETAQLPVGVQAKPLGWPLEIQPVLDADALDLAKELGLRLGIAAGRIWAHVLPQGLRSAQVRVQRFTEAAPQVLPLKALAHLPVAEQQLWAQALQQGTAHCLAPHTKVAERELCLLRADPPWPVRPLAKKQIALLDFLHEHGAVSRHSLCKAVQGSAPALAALVKAGHIAICHDEQEEAEAELALLPPPDQGFALSPAQQAAVDDALQALQSPSAASRLLYGVTGSGKTAVYLALARACLALGFSVLLLAPEVALALKLHRDVALALPEVPLFLYHGYQNPRLREKTFRSLAARTEPCVVVGTRSALFLPLPKVGLIVLDEEHDASFKQDDGFSYQAKEVAWFRVSQRKGLLLLGSATPDVKTFYAARQGSLPMLTLSQRVGGGTLPAVKLVDISKLATAQQALAPECEQALRATVQRGEQAIVLLNRRGYAPLLYCLDCKSVARCPHCEIALTYHKGREKLLCHYCGYTAPYPSPCPTCHSMNFVPMGEGTERLAESLSTLLAPYKVLRLDKDSTRRTGQMEAILASFARGEAQVLVGTQMLSKGHHFPNVTLAIIVDADLGLNLPDYRAAERTFQLLMQSAGRAGRGSKAGHVLIQTRNVNHYCWQYVLGGNFEAFYADEIARREKRHYPPFVRLARLRITWPANFAKGQECMAQLGASLRKAGRECGVTVLGPAPAPLALVNGQRRFHCLLKAQDWRAIRKVYFVALSAVKNKEIRFLLDLDPMNML